MYIKMDNSGVEDVCYEQEHVEKVLAEIKKNFDGYFMRFLDSTAGKGVSLESFQGLQKKLGVEISQKKKNNDLTNNYKTIIKEAIDDFEKDCKDYKKIFRQEWLEDLDEDADFFKSKTLRNECPIIRKTLANKKAKELDKYRASFSKADADWLLSVVANLCEFGDEYSKKYDPKTYEDKKTYKDLDMELLDTDDYTAFGVIGGGIKTHMLYKVHPAIFPNRSRSAIWALWYLTNKETFGCKTDSEFLMIDLGKSITQQNYFYPYQLFAFYAFEIYKLLRDKATEYKAYINPDYRYVIVDAFLEYIAKEHDSEISFLKSQIRDGGMSYA
ncbi:hypothetical protein [[Clostridium] polysaccharolyticum]|uniref:Uncharacterized protein n=1 Tax=[Clostridium] polysaccharolyticum TaxID=29364 RepID=A0A1I0CMJ8_9FIRM|nr:hypothetical protein [[Clostridium] polysaccharolyticum]SET20460.1 hypothetical protein SAMN04487772_11073 [[Clostridium] polysaccharolyticum]